MLFNEIRLMFVARTKTSEGVNTLPAPIFLPSDIKSTQKCERCGLRYPKTEEKCSHCADLSDREVDALKQRFEDENQGNANLGKIFLLVTVVLALLFAALLL